MRIHQIASHQYLTKNTKPQFRGITNIDYLQEKIAKDVEADIVSSDFANKTIEKLKNIKFNLEDNLKNFINNGCYIMNGQMYKIQKNSPLFAKAFEQIRDDVLLPVFKKSGLDCKDLPFKLEKSTDYELYFPAPSDKYLFDENGNLKGIRDVIELSRDFNSIEYDTNNQCFIQLDNETESDKKVAAWMYLCGKKADSKYPHSFTEVLNKGFDSYVLGNDNPINKIDRMFIEYTNRVGKSILEKMKDAR